MITYEDYRFAAGPALQNCSVPLSKAGRFETRPSKKIIQSEHMATLVFRALSVFFRCSFP